MIQYWLCPDRPQGTVERLCTWQVTWGSQRPPKVSVLPEFYR